jgi:hypothetical protein
MRERLWKETKGNVRAPAKEAGLSLSRAVCILYGTSVLQQGSSPVALDLKKPSTNRSTSGDAMFVEVRHEEDPAVGR